jgi:2-dehydro-3-deoxyphosphooctonate aldolase (KDO 8-P synthase)
MKRQSKIYNGNWEGDICSGVFLSPQKPVIMAGPCMLETRELGFQVANFMQDKCRQIDLPYVFKSSYDKANRTSVNSVRGPGIKKGLQWLSEIKEELNVPIVLDVHTPEQALEAARVADIIQIPAFLFQQRALLVAAASTGKTVQIKKGQWATSQEMIDVGHFLLNECGHNKIILVERGTLFGYNNLVVDFRNLIDMRKSGFAVVYDSTHAVQLPGAGDGRSLGLKDMVPSLIRGAAAIGIDGLFMEVHENPSKALSDAETQITLETAHGILMYLESFYHGKNSHFIHDMSNSLMVILNTAEYLRSECHNMTKEEANKFLSKIEETVHKLTDILRY